MSYFLKLLFVCLFLSVGYCQSSIDETLKKQNSGTVPYITTEELAATQNSILLDTRQEAEYKVSHINNAIWVGYKKFNIDSVMHRFPKRDAAIVVYCSVGVRSEDIGEILMKHGYTDVTNLYGGLFEWKNKDFPVVNLQGETTNKVHGFSKYWGKLLTNADVVY